jgi:type IV pilus assembly protein PilM
MELGGVFRPPTVGLDIGSNAIKAVVLRKSRGGWSLVTAGETLLPDNVAGENAVPDPMAVSEAVGDLLDSLHLRRARVTTGLSGHAVMVKRLSLPAMTHAELNDAIPWEAEQYIPFDLNDVQLDYQVLNGSKPGAGNTLDVLLVAAKRDRIEDRTSLIQQVGRRPVVVDVEAFALVNAYQMNYPDRTDALSVLVHVGHSISIVCVLEQGHPAFTRDISVGGQTHIDALAREFAEKGMDVVAAKRTLRGQPPAGIQQSDTATVLKAASAQIVLEVRKTVDFYRATAPAEKLSRIVVSGGACRATGLIDLFGSEFAVPVEIFDPFRRIGRLSREVATDETAPAYAVAVGLAMRRESDR